MCIRKEVKLGRKKAGAGGEKKSGGGGRKKKRGRGEKKKEGPIWEYGPGQ